MQSACPELQHTGSRKDVAERAKALFIHDSPTSRLDTVQNFLLQGKLGILPYAQSNVGVGGQRIRSLHRLQSRRRAFNLRRMFHSWTVGRRSVDFLPCMPPLARE